MEISKLIGKQNYRKLQLNFGGNMIWIPEEEKMVTKNQSVPVISVIGESNSGKTTLITKLIPVLKKRGYRIGVIKHNAHRFKMDYPGKDTWRMTKSGADTVVISGSKQLAMLQTLPDKEREVDEIIRQLFPHVDLVITEGYKTGTKPKLEVTRTGNLLTKDNAHLIAVVYNPVRRTSRVETELLSRLPVPVFNIKEITKIVNFLTGLTGLNKLYKRKVKILENNPVNPVRKVLVDESC